MKLHGGPISCSDLDKLDSLSEGELLSEVRYLRQTVAPNIREKRKVGNKFEKFSIEELKSQVSNVLKPENDYVEDIDNLLLQLMNRTSEASDAGEEDEEPNKDVGKVAVMEGPLKERRVGLVVSKDAVQLYHVTRYGLEPDDVTETLSDWQIVTLVDDYDFITRRTGVYMRCSVAKKDLSSA